MPYLDPVFIKKKLKNQTNWLFSLFLKVIFEIFGRFQFVFFLRKFLIKIFCEVSFRLSSVGKCWIMRLETVLVEIGNIFLLGLATSRGFWRVFRFVNSSAVVATANSDQFFYFPFNTIFTFSQLSWHQLELKAIRESERNRKEKKYFEKKENNILRGRQKKEKEIICE